MAEYRIYGLSSDGHFAWAVDAICATDAEACEIARATPKPEREREVWRGTTRVALLIGRWSIIDNKPPAASNFGTWAH